MTIITVNRKQSRAIKDLSKHFIGDKITKDKATKDFINLTKQHDKVVHTTLLFKPDSVLVKHVKYELEWEGGTEYSARVHDVVWHKGADKLIRTMFGIKDIYHIKESVMEQFDLYDYHLPTIEKEISKKNKIIIDLCKETAQFEKKYKLEKDWYWDNYGWC